MVLLHKEDIMKDKRATEAPHLPESQKAHLTDDFVVVP